MGKATRENKNPCVVFKNGDKEVLIYNATAHPIRFVKVDGNEIIFPVSTYFARIDDQTEFLGEIAPGVPTYRRRLYGGSGIPKDEVPGTYYIVSGIFHSASAHRGDLLVPDNAVRDEKGRTTGCFGFYR